jgi:hypothetical protein
LDRECKAIEKERMMSLEPLAARVLKYRYIARLEYRDTPLGK